MQISEKNGNLYTVLQKLYLRSAKVKELQDYIRCIPDFPEPGIMFRDITTILQDAEGFKLAVESLKEMLADTDVDVIAAVEARGFVFAGALAYALNKPLVLIRKKGKLPFDTVSEEYDLEYGTAVLEMHTDSIKKGQKVVILDDILATGGTLKASVKLIERLGGKVSKIICITELKGLKGRDTLKGYTIESAVAFEGK